LQSEIFSYLCFRSGEKLSQREIAGILGVSPTAVANSLESLGDEKFVEIEKTKTINFVCFNRNEEKALVLKRAENLKNIYFLRNKMKMISRLSLVSKILIYLNLIFI
jgi:Mn-dependent DtxR family transcriptional regulator